MMLDAARRLIKPSARSGVPPFMVMDVMAAAARIEAAGGRSGPRGRARRGARARRPPLAAAQTARATGRIDSPGALGIRALGARIARHYAERYGVTVEPERIVVTTGSSAGFILAFLALF